MAHPPLLYYHIGSQRGKGCFSFLPLPLPFPLRPVPPALCHGRPLSREPPTIGDWTCSTTQPKRNTNCNLHRKAPSCPLRYTRLRRGLLPLLFFSLSLLSFSPLSPPLHPSILTQPRIPPFTSLILIPCIPFRSSSSVSLTLPRSHTHSLSLFLEP